jgi:hypothetical protein
MSSGFTKTFRFIALVLLLSVMQVYVLAHPATTSTTFATKNTEAVSNPVVTDHQLNFINQNQVASAKATETTSNQTQLASERNITFAPKSPLSLAFTKASGERAATKTAFLKVRKGTFDLMMSPKGHPTNRPVADDDNDSDDGDGDRKALYVASAIVIGAAVAIFIGFRHDRDDDGIRGQ